MDDRQMPAKQMKGENQEGDQTPFNQWKKWDSVLNRDISGYL